MFPLIHLPSCYWTVWYWTLCYWTVCYRTVRWANHILSCSLNQPITFKVVMTCVRACTRLLLCFWRLITGRKFFISFGGILIEIFPFFHNWVILLSKIVILWLIGSKTSCRQIRTVIILVMNKSDSRFAVVRFCYHSYDYRPNWTPLSPITITYWK